MLKTPRAVINALGGSGAVMEITELKAPAVSNWRRGRRFPAWTYLELTEALRAKRKPSAPPQLWGQRHYRKKPKHKGKNGRA